MHFLQALLPRNRRGCVLVQWTKVTAEIQLLMDVYGLVPQDCAVVWSVAKVVRISAQRTDDATLRDKKRPV